MILLSDANVLIDLGYVGGLQLLPMLGRTEVLSTVLLECHDARQPELMSQIADVGIVTVEATRALLEAADAYAAEDDELSLQDRQCLLYARDQERVLITGDLMLRNAAQRERVTFHGTVWLVEEAYNRSLIGTADLCRWLTQWPLQRRRLPASELARLRALMGCP